MLGREFYNIYNEGDLTKITLKVTEVALELIGKQYKPFIDALLRNDPHTAEQICQDGFDFTSFCNTTISHYLLHVLIRTKLATAAIWYMTEWWFNINQGQVNDATGHIPSFIS